VPSGKARGRGAVVRWAAPGSLAVLLALLVVCALAAATPVWMPPVDLSSPGARGGTPLVALDDAGDAVAVWRQQDEHIVAATHPAGGAWSAPQAISGPGVQASTVGVAMGAAGDVMAYWIDASGGNGPNTFQSAVRPAGGAWEPPETLPLPIGVVRETISMALPQVALDRAGGAVATWTQFTIGSPAQASVLASVRPAGGPWQGPQVLSDPAQLAQGIDLALSPAGDAVAVWASGQSPNAVIEAAARQAGASAFGPVTVISAPGINADHSQVGMDSAGNALALWHTADGAYEATRPAGGQWTSPQLALGSHDTGGVAADGSFTVGPGGEAALVWTGNPLRPPLFVAVRSAGGGWSAPQLLTTPYPESFRGTPVAQIDASGQVTVAWTISQGNGALISAARAAPGASFGPPEDVAREDVQVIDFDFRLNGAGDGLLGWSTATVRASALKAGPVLAGLEVPAQATAQTPVEVSVTARDAWSALVGSPSWDFGDGAGAVGEHASHTYAAPGTYTVTVSATDAAGAQSQLRQQLSVLPPAPKPGSLPGTTRPPGLSALAAHPARFRVRSGCIGSSAGATSAGPVRCRRSAVGTELSFRLSTPAAVRVEARTVAVRRRVCAAGRCRVRMFPSRLVGTLSVRGRAGVNRVRVSGRFHGTLLAPGPYALRVQASRSGRSSVARLVRVVVIS
jgi:PKD domain-containing protein